MSLSLQCVAERASIYQHHGEETTIAELSALTRVVPVQQEGGE